LKGQATLFLVAYLTKELWLPDWYKEQRGVRRESARESAIYEKLKKGLEFREAIEAVIERESLVKEVTSLITPTESKCPYPLIVGEYGTGKTSLIELAVNKMDKDKPKGIVYVDVPPKCKSEADIANALLKALGWRPDPVINSSKGNYSNSLPVGIVEANRFAAAFVEEALGYFFSAALKYQQEYKKVPVLVTDNASKLSRNQQDVLSLLPTNG